MVLRAAITPRRGHEFAHSAFRPSMKRTTSEGRRPRAGADRTAERRAGRPRRLPAIRISGRAYYLDERLGEFRAVDDPSKRIPIEVVALALIIQGKWPA